MLGFPGAFRLNATVPLDTETVMELTLVVTVETTEHQIGGGKLSKLRALGPRWVRAATVD